MKILMVCLGNICRSPLAEGVLRSKTEKLGLNWKIDSAGTNGFHVGEAPHHLSQKVAKLHGIDISCQVARRFVKNDIGNYDIIYAMAADVIDDIKKIAGEAYDPKKIKLYMEELYPGQHLDVPDPWYGTEPGYHEVFDMINETSDAIIRRYSSSLIAQD